MEYQTATGAGRFINRESKLSKIPPDFSVRPPDPEGQIKRARNKGEAEIIVPAPNPKIDALLPKISGVGLLSGCMPPRITYDLCSQWGRRSVKLHSAAHQAKHQPINNQVAFCDGEQVERAWSQVVIKKRNLTSDWFCFVTYWAQAD
ncbi:hypothetical protein B0H14DRAFT_2611139 [Mycena olivaceomarginata]|nr:hypothetical protein B0H14DRAFT_2611139 [Mycena olivaceomarginata]